MTFGSSYREFRKLKGSRNRDSTVLLVDVMHDVKNYQGEAARSIYTPSGFVYVVETGVKTAHPPT